MSPGKTIPILIRTPLSITTQGILDFFYSIWMIMVRRQIL